MIQRRLRRVGVALLAAALPLLPFAANAAPPTFAERHPDLRRKIERGQNDAARAAELDKARALFAEGMEARKAEDFAKCEEKFAEAWSLKSSGRILVNLGLCEHRLGYRVDAAEHLREALAWLDLGDNDYLELAADELVAVSRKIGTFHMKDAPEGALITITPKPSTPGEKAAKPRSFTAPVSEAIFLEPGAYTLRIVSDAGLLYTKEMVFHPGDDVVHVYHLPEPPPPTLSLPVVFGGAGLSALMLGAGIGWIVASQGRLAEAARLRPQIGAIFGSETGACHAPQGALLGLCNKLDAATDDGALFEDLGIGSFVAGGLLAAGTITFALWPRKPEAPPAVTGLTTLRVLPQIGRSGGGLTIGGAW